MEHVMVDGILRDLDAVVRAVAERSVRVLRGESADAIPVTTAAFTAAQTDWRQLRRWGIDERRVPSGASLLYRNPSVWERYRTYIVGAVVTLFAESALISALLVQAVRRRRTERHLQASQDQLRASYDRIRRLGGQLLRAQEDERARIARELHDDISQQMAVLAIDLAALAGRDRAAGREHAERLADAALQRTHTVAEHVRDLSHRLHPANLAQLGIVP